MANKFAARCTLLLGQRNTTAMNARANKCRLDGVGFVVGALCFGARPPYSTRATTIKVHHFVFRRFFNLGAYDISPGTRTNLERTEQNCYCMYRMKNPKGWSRYATRASHTTWKKNDSFVPTVVLLSTTNRKEALLVDNITWI